MKNLMQILVLAAVVLVVGCAGYKTPIYSSDYVAVDSLKAYRLKKLAVENVKPEDSEAEVNKITLRGGSLVVEGGTFATYLQNAIKNDLIEIGAYDPTSQTTLDVTILKNDIDVSGFSDGKGEIEILLKVRNRDAVLLEKSYIANTQFDSAFAAMVAVPKGQSEYPKLVKKLLATVYADKQFISAIKR